MKDLPSRHVMRRKCGQSSRPLFQNLSVHPVVVLPKAGGQSFLCGEGRCKEGAQQSTSVSPRHLCLVQEGLRVLEESGDTALQALQGVGTKACLPTWSGTTTHGKGANIHSPLRSTRICGFLWGGWTCIWSPGKATSSFTKRCAFHLDVSRSVTPSTNAQSLLHSSRKSAQGFQEEPKPHDVWTCLCPQCQRIAI